jgi:4-alpha-glucanotransferase
MTEAALRTLAARAGVLVEWDDYTGARRQVPADTLRQVLAALRIPCDDQHQIAGSTQRLAAAEDGPGAMLVGEAGSPMRLPAGRGGHARLALEDGGSQDLRRDDERGIRFPDRPGYHRLLLDERELPVAATPRRCMTVADIAPGRRLWGLAAQIYGIRRTGDGGIGDMGGVARLAIAAGRRGADLIALSPDHALFAADIGRFGPYGPSSRLFLNPLLADPELVFGVAAVEAARTAPPPPDDASLIDWQTAGAAKLALLRALFRREARAGDGRPVADFQRFLDEGGEALHDHARFEALHAHHGAADWRSWPAPLRDPRGRAVADFVAAHADEVLFHAFLQWVAARSRHAAQSTAREAGMRIGLVSDLAVGMDSGGSHAWSRQEDVLVGLSVGAPPDLINSYGQGWGLTAFSPHALKAGAYAPFLATLRAAMRDAGGVRIDHVLGLNRLWVIPEGARATEGAYLTYPLDDLLRLIALESQRHRAIVIGEDLGTVPEGLRARLDAVGIQGMRVLWFERDDRGFIPPERWSPDTAAMTTTHDLPTVAGWWRGSDISVRADAFGIAEAALPAERSARAAERTRLWQALVAAGAAAGDAPAPEDTAPAVDGAVRFVAEAASRLAIIPLEDVLGLEEQPNLPGTIDQHPNWRRRLPETVDHLLDAPAAAARLDRIAEARRRP